MRLRTKLSLMTCTLLAILWLVGVGLPLAQIHFEKPAGGANPFRLQADSTTLLNVKNLAGSEYFNVDTTSPLGLIRAMNHTVGVETDAGGVWEKGALQSTPTWTTASNSSITVTGLGSYPTTGGSTNLGRLIGLSSSPTHSGSGTLSSLYGAYFTPHVDATGGPVTTLLGFYLTTANSNAASTITTMEGLRIDMNKFTTGPVTTAKAINIRSGFGGVVGDKHGIYVEDTSAMNYFGGPVGIGAMTNPTQLLHVSTNSDAQNSMMQMELHSTSSASPAFLSRKSRGTQASPIIVATDDHVMTLQGVAYHGSAYIAIADIRMLVDGTVTSGQRPGSRISFRTTTPNGSLAERWQINNPGHLIAGTDNTYDIGASGATRPRTLYLGTSVITPAITITGGSPGSGKVLTSDGSGVGTWQTPSAGVTGSGSTNQLPKFTSSSVVGDSLFSDDGTTGKVRKQNIGGVDTFQVIGEPINTSSTAQLRIDTTNSFSSSTGAIIATSFASYAGYPAALSMLIQNNLSGDIYFATSGQNTRAQIGSGGLTLSVPLVMAAHYANFTEMSAPAAPAANEGRIYAEDNGSGKTRLCAKFSSGAAQCFATEP